MTEKETNEAISLDFRLEPKTFVRRSIKTLTTFLKIKNNKRRTKIKLTLTKPIKNKT